MKIATVRRVFTRRVRVYRTFGPADAMPAVVYHALACIPRHPEWNETSRRAPLTPHRRLWAIDESPLVTHFQRSLSSPGFVCFFPEPLYILLSYLKVLNWL